MARKKVFRAVVLFLCCFSVLFSCLVTVSGTGIYDESETNFDSLIGGTAEFYVQSYSGPKMDWVVTSDITETFSALSNGDTYVLASGNSYYDYNLLTGGTQDSMGLVIRAQYTDSYLDFRDYEYHRIYVDYDFTDSGDANMISTTWKAVYKLDPFYFDWNSDLLHNLVRIKSFALSNITVSGDLWYLNDLGQTAKHTFDLVLAGAGKNANGAQWTQSVFTNNFCNYFVKECGLSDNDGVLFTNLKVVVEVIQPTNDSINSIGRTGIEYLSMPTKGTNIFAGDSVSKFLHYVRSYGSDGSGDVGSLPPETNFSGVFTGFLASAIAGFFDTEIYPGFTLGGVFVVIIVVCLMVAILKFFR